MHSHQVYNTLFPSLTSTQERSWLVLKLYLNFVNHQVVTVSSDMDHISSDDKTTAMGDATTDVQQDRPDADNEPDKEDGLCESGPVADGTNKTEGDTKIDE